MSANERADKFRERQEKAGRQLVTMYLPSDLVAQMDREIRPTTRGELVEVALGDYLTRKLQQSASA